jgi:hypothetical protein
MRRTMTIVAAAALLLAACDSDDEPADSVSLDDEQPALDEPTVDDEAPTTEDDDPGAGDGDGSDGDGSDGDGSDGDDADAEVEADGDEASTAADLVDLTEAVPGTWPVGDAGTVTFSIEDGALALEDVSANDGWSADIDEEDDDEIEVDFRQGDVEWQIEIELNDGGSTLEIEIDQQIRDADPGSYEIGDAGTFAFELDGDSLVLTDLSVEDGWTVTEQEEDDDEIELELENGPREFDVEVELDDGVIDIDMQYDVVGPVPD